MTGVATWLLLLGACDLFRAHRDLTSLRRRLTLAGATLAGTVVAALAADPSGRGWWGWAGVGASAALWVLASAAALGRARALPPGVPLVRGRWLFTTAYVALLAGLVAVVLCGPAMGEVAAFERLVDRSVAADTDAALLLLVAGVLLVQVSTANVVVRLLLDLVGVPAHDNEKQLKGGRVLGPMERVVVVGLGLSGNLTGASLVIAAKALLRFPELRSPAPGALPPGGPSDVTEYFLVGSLASWLFAFAGVALVAVVR
ncbi:hypothetical protein ACOACO_11945 [Nocardioides sp. CPCC 205120]|uniref:hypothetical protein n=1 Tax=Nocardioides sp. CPCC 205120 TaxID=3406462 RepID=UPI003B50BB1C